MDVASICSWERILTTNTLACLRQLHWGSGLGQRALGIEEGFLADWISVLLKP